MGTTVNRQPNPLDHINIQEKEKQSQHAFQRHRQVLFGCPLWRPTPWVSSEVPPSTRDAGHHSRMMEMRRRHNKATTSTVCIGRTLVCAHKESAIKSASFYQSFVIPEVIQARRKWKPQKRIDGKQAGRQTQSWVWGVGVIVRTVLCVRGTEQSSSWGKDGAWGTVLGLKADSL